MYIAKTSKHGVYWNAELLEKTWDSEIESHRIKIISSNKHFFRWAANRWLNKELSRILFSRHELEIIDG
jgi:hypothetical protein